ncbi:MAG TPA: DUF4215 domain-containing protein, partial [Nannocystis sp.]
CKTATCGDGVVQAGVEQCDDGNVVATDACTGTCATAKCGDGIIQAGVEQCDDGNAVDNDGCSNLCKVGATTCAHSACLSGAALSANSCSYTGTNNDCVAKVCAIDPFCCGANGGNWDATCVAEAKDASICPTGLNPTNFSCTCAHSYCTVGGLLARTCDPCVKKICELDSFCCNTSWDQACVNQTVSVCKMPAAPNCK